MLRQLLLIFILIQYHESARILTVFPFPSISHQKVFQPIWKELSLRGHEVIVVTPNPLNDPTLTNLTEININYVYQVIRISHGFQFFNRSDSSASYTSIIDRIIELTTKVSERTFEDKEFRKIYTDKSQKFDLILVQTFFTPIFYSLSSKFGAPVIGLSSMDGWVGSHYAIGNPVPPALYSEMIMPSQGNLPFFDRVYSLYYSIWSRLYINYILLPKCDKIVKKYLGDEMPKVADSEKNVSMIFLYKFPVLHPVRPNVPAIVHIGGLHVNTPKPLPDDLQVFLDNSPEGVIYFSLGSNVQSINMPERLRENIMDAFSQLPFKVLWKFENDSLPNKPKNVLIRKWLPQQDILHHPNIKAFISQCGLQSVTEAVTNEIPIIGIPVITDQFANVQKLSEFGAAIGFDFLTLNKDEFKSAIIEIVENSKYKEKMKELKRIFNDEPMAGLEKAIWWSEYVIRHKGAPHLRSPTADIPLYQYLMLDVFAAFCLLAFFCYVIVKVVYINVFFKINKRKMA